MKRLISLVLVAALSFFSFMVYAEDPGNGNTGVLPTTLVGTLNFANGEAMLNNNGYYQGYAYINGSYQILYESKVGSSNTSDNKLKVPAGWDVGSFTFCFGALAGKSSFTANYVMAQPDGVYCISFEVISGDGTRLHPSSATTIDNRLEVIGYSGSTVFLRCLEAVPLNVMFKFTGTLPHSTNGYVVLAALNAQYLGQYSGALDFQEWLDNNYQGAVNSGQAGANQEIQDNVGQLEDFDNKIFTDVSDYTSQLDFGLGDWSEAAAGISYIGSIFMLVWDNSPTQVIVLSLMVGLCLLILGRGPRVAGEVRRHEERASRRKKGG